MAGVTLPSIHSVDSGLTKVLARLSASAGQAARPPDLLLAPSAPSSAPRAHARTSGPAGGMGPGLLQAWGPRTLP